NCPWKSAAQYIWLPLETELFTWIFNTDTHTFLVPGTQDSVAKTILLMCQSQSHGSGGAVSAIGLRITNMTYGWTTVASAPATGTTVIVGLMKRDRAMIVTVPFSSHITSLLPLQNLAMMTSLEFMWDLDTSLDVLPWIRSEDVEKVKLKRWKVFKDLMSMINKSTFQSLQKLVLVIVHQRDGWRWFPDEIMAASQTKPLKFMLLDPPDRIAKEFGGQLQKFELTLPYDRAADLESKMVDKMDRTQVIMSHPGLAMIRKFWRSIPKQLPIHEGLGFSGELGCWIIHGHCLSPGIRTCTLS
ncbi:hypothetical protein V501_06784, partial [Pseudogymnoascus sp. VKM F-4519 (FW-2642)]